MTALIASNSFPFCSPPQEASSVYIFSTSCAILRCSKFMAPETLFIDDELFKGHTTECGRRA